MFKLLVLIVIFAARNPSLPGTLHVLQFLRMNSEEERRDELEADTVSLDSDGDDINRNRTVVSHAQKHPEYSDHISV
ncbi:hypothetical protein DPMN_047532 [Dreissena polymorpha]|uniref:Secreted protein n=1 Tax=Dreissena polymorpha TaxID=45954 RepID=A0A9D4D8Z9_DREPO|nr:hypothetical protein DPMN_047532 [Dreissena polymorpha]